jgi:hypothetical protein
MRSLLKWHDNKYFEQRKDDQFLVEIVQLRVCVLTLYRGNYWFEYPGMHVKATTTPCVSLNDLQGTKVHYKDYPIIKGILGGYGVINTPYVYVFWGQVPMKDNLYNFAHMTPNAGKPLGFPCSLPDNKYLILL